MFSCEVTNSIHYYCPISSPLDSLNMLSASIESPTEPTIISLDLSIVISFDTQRPTKGRSVGAEFSIY